MKLQYQEWQNEIKYIIVFGRHCRAPCVCVCVYVCATVCVLQVFGGCYEAEHQPEPYS